MNFSSFNTINSPLIQPTVIENIQLDYEDEIYENVTFIDCWLMIKSIDFPKKTPNLISKIQFFLKKMGNCTGNNNNKNEEFTYQKEQILLFRKKQFNDNEILHNRILLTIYREITGIKKVIRYGNHWEKIGFIGKDPSTNLSGVGMFGLVQILAFISLKKTLLIKIYEYSINENESVKFPLCCTLLHITQIVLELLEAGKLNKVIYNLKSAINAINYVYIAFGNKFFNEYKGWGFTLTDIQSLLNNIKERYWDNPEKLLPDIANYTIN